MARESLNPDLNGTLCTVADCLEAADTMSVQTLRIRACVGFADGDREIVLDIPLCLGHAQQVGIGVESWRFDSLTGD